MGLRRAKLSGGGRRGIFRIKVSDKEQNPEQGISPPLPNAALKAEVLSSAVLPVVVHPAGGRWIFPLTALWTSHCLKAPSLPTAAPGGGAWPCRGGRGLLQAPTAHAASCETSRAAALSHTAHTHLEKEAPAESADEYGCLNPHDGSG